MSSQIHPPLPTALTRPPDVLRWHPSSSSNFSLKGEGRVNLSGGIYSLHFHGRTAPPKASLCGPQLWTPLLSRGWITGCQCSPRVLPGQAERAPIKRDVYLPWVPQLPDPCLGPQQSRPCCILTFRYICSASQRELAPCG